jgi:protein-glutamine gamma-glutamyltransferase
MSEKQAVIEVSRFFKENFSYSLNRQQRYPKGKYLANFLFKNRQGHCEYFATATALLLRSVNIPTRYVVGYSIDEYSSLERQYIARARHAHSWTQVYVNNQWQILDTTPAVWAPFEEENASAIEPLMDLWAWVSYTWALWQSEDVVDEEDKSVYLLWLLIPLIAVLAWRMYFKERVKHRASSSTNEPELVFADVESSFYQLINHIQDDGLTRHPGETLYAWFDRILSSGKNQQLQTALKLHYQYRFDPRGLSVADTTELKRLVAHLISSKPEWLHGQRQS